MKKSWKIHMWKGTAREGYFLCGRDMTIKTPLTTDKSLVTCMQCLGSLNRKGKPLKIYLHLLKMEDLENRKLDYLY